MRQKIFIIGEPSCKPVYDENMHLLHWELKYKTSNNVTETRYFRDTLLSRGYKKMCRFQTRFLRQQNENTK